MVAYYESHPAEFETGETVTLRQILVPTENEARDVRRRLQKDQKSFEALARARSKAPGGAPRAASWAPSPGASSRPTWRPPPSPCPRGG